jgi:hypothetical protein
MYKIPTMHTFDSLLTIGSDWPRHAKRLRNWYPHLTDEDLQSEPGRENEMLLRLEGRLNKSREEVVRIVRNVRMDRFDDGSNG